MKRIVSVAIAAGAVMVLSTASAHAQVSVGVGGGVTLPMGDFKDAAKTGWHGLANVGYEMPSGLGIRGDFFYGQNSFKGNVDGKGKLAGGFGNLTYSFKSASVHPYVIGTVGFMNVKAEATAGGITASASQTKVGFGGGAGLKFKAGTDSNIFVEGRYISINTDGGSTNFIPITVGISFGLK